MFDIKFSGTIETQALLTITKPLSKQPTAREKQELGVPHVNVRRDGKFVRTPVLPGETLKGMLRAAATAIHRDHAGGIHGLDEYYLLAIGGIKGSEKEAAADILKSRDFRRKSPILGLMGSATPWLAGRLRVEMAFPQSSDLVADDRMTGSRNDPMRRDPELANDLSDEDNASYANYTQVNKAVSGQRNIIGKLENDLRSTRKRLEGKSASDRAAGEAKMAELDVELVKAKAELDKLLEDDDYSNAIGRPLEGNRAISPGSLFTHSMMGVALLDTEIGFLLKTLERLSYDCRLGGKANSGYGRFKADYTMKIRPTRTLEFAPCGTVSVEQDQFSMTTDGDLIKQCIAAWDSFAADPANFVPGNIIEKA